MANAKPVKPITSATVAKMNLMAVWWSRLVSVDMGSSRAQASLYAVYLVVNGACECVRHILQGNAYIPLVSEAFVLAHPTNLWKYRQTLKLCWAL